MDLIQIWNSIVSFFEYRAHTLPLLSAIIAGAEAYARALPFNAHSSGRVDATPDAYRDSFNRVSATYEELATDTSSRIERFRDWYEELLPLQWHTDVFGESQVESLLDQHAAVIRGVTPREDLRRVSFGRSDRRDDFDRVLRIYLARDHPPQWLAGYHRIAVRRQSEHSFTLQRLSALAQGQNDQVVTPSVTPDIASVVAEQSLEGLVVLKRALQALDQHLADSTDE